ncbi:MAG: DUF4231 domain-containing protein [Cyanobacteriota bacterium]|nr:DUF4231 domain-containing protein [Cyanobacteriota bacterium]
MAKKNAYREYLKQEFTDLIDTLELSSLQKRFMKSRWLDQLLWLESRAERTSKWSNRLRLMTIIGGVMVPGLVSLNFNDSQLGKSIGWATFGLSQVVAISAAVEEYFRFSDKRTQYRQTAESLKSEMWKFAQLTGSYQDYGDHAQAYSIFASQVENYLQEDLQAFIELAQKNANAEQQPQESLDKKPLAASEAKVAASPTPPPPTRPVSLEKPPKPASDNGKTTPSGSSIDLPNSGKKS